MPDLANQITDEEKRHQAIADIGLIYAATFIPTKQPEKEVKNPQLHWKIELGKETKKVDGDTVTHWPFSCDYHEGCAHVKGYKQIWGGRTLEDREQEKLIRKTCETGFLYKLGMSFTFNLGPQPAPKLADVLSCLLMDSSCLDSPFEEWTADMGGNPDSIKEKALYDLAVKQTITFKRLMSCAQFETLREVFQDY